MPRYRIEHRVSGTDTWVAGPVIDVATAPTSVAPRVETIGGLTNGSEYDFRVVRLTDAGPADITATSSVKKGRPTRFGIDFTDVFDKGVTVNWTDQRGGKYYRVDHWTTDTDDPAVFTETAVTLAGSDDKAGQGRITGLANGTTYRIRVNRLKGSGGDVARRTLVVQATPNSDFEQPPDGFTADGPAAVSQNGDLKAQVVTDGDGVPGILIALKSANFSSLTVAYVQGGVSVARSRSQSTASLNFTQVANTKQTYFCAIPDLRTNPITVPDSSPAVNGAKVTLVLQGGQATSFVVQPTYVL